MPGKNSLTLGTGCPFACLRSEIWGKRDYLGSEVQARRDYLGSDISVPKNVFLV